MSELPYPIAETLPDPVFLIAPNHTLSWMNSAAEHWLRRSNTALIGKHIRTLTQGLEFIETNVINALEIHTVTRGHDLNIRAHGQNYLCDYLVFPCAPSAAIMLKVKPIGRDRNTGKGQNEAVTMLGRMLVHELKNPLAGIYGAAQLLESEINNPNDRELVQLIKTEVDRISRLAEKMEGFGTEKQADFEEFNIHSVLRKAMLLLQSQGHKGIMLTEEYDPSLPSAFGDQDAIMQVIVNLLANASEAITQSGKGDMIKLRTSYRAGVHRNNKAGVRCALPINVKIIDNGPGIDEGLIARVFDPFVTAKANGHGLGLALVAKIVEDHGGLIDVHSEPGKTVFSILLPTHNRITKKA